MSSVLRAEREKSLRRRYGSRTMIPTRIVIDLIPPFCGRLRAEIPPQVRLWFTVSSDQDRISRSFFILAIWLFHVNAFLCG